MLTIAFTIIDVDFASHRCLSCIPEAERRLFHEEFSQPGIKFC